MNTWKYAYNTFDVRTRDSNRIMLSISTDVYSKLKAAGLTNAEIFVLFTTFEPVHLAYRAIYVNYEVMAGKRQGKTLNLFTLITEEMGLQIRDWERKVRNVYIEDSPEEKAYFPNKRSPFLNGTYEERIVAVAALGQLLAQDADASLVAYAPTVISFHNLLLAARDSQQQDEGSLAQLSTSRESQRLLLAQEMYAVLGGLMRIFKANPLAIEGYFPMELLRDGETDLANIIKTGNVGANMQLNVPLAGAYLSAATNMNFFNPFTDPGSVVTAQFHSTTNAAFDSNRNHIQFQSQSPAVNWTAEEVGYDETLGFTNLILYANNQQAAFRIEIEQ